LTTSLFLSFLHAVARNTRAKLADVGDGTTIQVATYPMAMQAFAWSMLVIGIPVAAVIGGYDALHGAVVMGTVISVAIVVVLLGTVAELTRVRVEWTDTAVTLASPWSTPRSLDWDEIVEVTYSPTAAWFVVRGRGGAKIRLPNLLGGLGDLFEEMKRRGSDELRGQIDGVTVKAWKRWSGW
jgi:hypothetical protein